MRGGLGVRKRLSEESLRETYRLNGVRSGFAVARCYVKYGRWELGYTVGIIVRKTASIVQVRWADAPDDTATYDQGDARYEIDRGRWRVLGLIQGNPLDPDNPISSALTRLGHDARMTEPADAGTPPTEETDEDMSEKMSKAAQERAAAQHAVKNGNLPDRETYTAKQIATRCGTDSKTMRKFFRSNHSTVQAVGQGGRYEFDAKDVPTIMREFAAWRKKATSRPIKPTPPKQGKSPMAPAPEVVEALDGAVIDPAQVQEILNQHDDPDITMDQLADAIERAQGEITAVDDLGPNEERYYEEPSDEELMALESEELDLDDIDED